MSDEEFDSNEITPPLNLNGVPKHMSDSQRNRLSGGAQVAQMLSSKPAPEEQRYIEMLRQADVDPVVLGLRLGLRMHRIEQERDTGEQERAEQGRVLLDLPDRVTALEESDKARKSAPWRIAAALVGTVFAAAIGIVSALQSRAALEARLQEQIINIKESIGDLKRHNERDNQPRAYQPWWPPVPPQTKDQKDPSP